MTDPIITLENLSIGYNIQAVLHGTAAERLTPERPADLLEMEVG